MRQIVWDEWKRETNLQKRGMDFRAITWEWLDSAVIVDAKLDRLKAVGMMDGKPVAVIFEPLGTEAYSIVSFRIASRKERRLL